MVVRAVTRDQVQALLKVVDAKIATQLARGSSDGGLVEAIREDELTEELLQMFPEQED